MVEFLIRKSPVILGLLIGITCTCWIFYKPLSKIEGPQKAAKTIAFLGPFSFFGMLLGMIIDEFKIGGDIFVYILSLLMISGSIYFVFLGLTWRVRLNRLGSIWINLGRVKRSDFVMLGGWIMAVITPILTWLILDDGPIYNASDQINYRFIFPSTAMIFAYLCFSIYGIMMGLRKSYVCQKGLFYMTFAIEWDKITSYHWSNDNLNVLSLEIESRNSKSQALSITIKPSLQKEVEAVLQRVGIPHIKE